MAIARDADQKPLLRASLLVASILVAFIGAPASASQTAQAEASLAVAEGFCTGDAHSRYEVCTTEGGVEDRLIARKIKAKVDATADAAQDGDYIRIAMYDWGTDGGGTAVANSLVRALDRGVSVRVVMGAGNVPVKEKLRAAGADVRVCPNACMPDTDRGAMHNKFVLIKKGDTKLVMQTSSNLNATQAEHAQNLLISRDDPELFSHYVNYWRRLYVGSWTWSGETWSDADKARYGTNDKSRVYFYPRSDSADPLAGALEAVDGCREGDDRVWVSASLFKVDQRPRIIAQLASLRSSGCDVRILVQKEADREAISRGTTIPVRCNQWNHSKFTLIDARYHGEWRKVVFVGSYNLTENSRGRANDTMLRVINGWVTNRYIEHFETLYTNQHGCDSS